MNITEFKAGDLVEYKGKIYKIDAIVGNVTGTGFSLLLYDWINDPFGNSGIMVKPSKVKVSEAVKVLYGIPK